MRGCHGPRGVDCSLGRCPRRLGLFGVRRGGAGALKILFLTHFVLVVSEVLAESLPIFFYIMHCALVVAWSGLAGGVRRGALVEPGSR